MSEGRGRSAFSYVRATSVFKAGREGPVEMKQRTLRGPAESRCSVPWVPRGLGGGGWVALGRRGTLSLGLSPAEISGFV